MLKLLVGLYQRLHLKMIPVQKTYDRKPTSGCDNRKPTNIYRRCRKPTKKKLTPDTTAENLRIYRKGKKLTRKNSRRIRWKKLTHIYIYLYKSMGKNSRRSPSLLLRVIQLALPSKMFVS